MAKLVQEERYALAVYVAKRWSLGERAAWAAWARSLIMCAPWQSTIVDLQA